MTVPVNYLGLFFLGPENEPAIIFHWKQTNRILPVYVGLAAATVLSSMDNGVTARRPRSVDLIEDILEAHQDGVDFISIDACHNGVFYSTAHCTSGHTFDVRTSDAVDLALTVESEIVAEEAILKTYSIPVTQELIAHMSDNRELQSEKVQASIDVLLKTLETVYEEEPSVPEAPESLSDGAVGDEDFEKLMGNLGFSEDDFKS